MVYVSISEKFLWNMVSTTTIYIKTRRIYI